MYMYMYMYIVYMSVYFVMLYFLYLSASCYDPQSHCVWTSNDDWVDVWECSGKVRLAVHHLAARLGKSSVAELIPELDNTQTTAEGI